MIEHRSRVGTIHQKRIPDGYVSEVQRGDIRSQIH